MKIGTYSSTEIRQVGGAPVYRGHNTFTIDHPTWTCWLRPGDYVATMSTETGLQGRARFIVEEERAESEPLEILVH